MLQISSVLKGSIPSDACPPQLNAPIADSPAFDTNEVQPPTHYLSGDAKNVADEPVDQGPMV